MFNFSLGKKQNLISPRASLFGIWACGGVWLGVGRISQSTVLPPITVPHPKILVA